MFTFGLELGGAYLFSILMFLLRFFWGFDGPSDGISKPPFIGEHKLIPHYCSVCLIFIFIIFMWWDCKVQIVFILFRFQVYLFSFYFVSIFEFSFG